MHQNRHTVVAIAVFQIQKQLDGGDHATFSVQSKHDITIWGLQVSVTQCVLC